MVWCACGHGDFHPITTCTNAETTGSCWITVYGDQVGTSSNVCSYCAFILPTLSAPDPYMADAFFSTSKIRPSPVRRYGSGQQSVLSNPPNITINNLDPRLRFSHLAGPVTAMKVRGSNAHSTPATPLQPLPQSISQREPLSIPQSQLPRFSGPTTVQDPVPFANAIAPDNSLHGLEDDEFYERLLNGVTSDG